MDQYGNDSTFGEFVDSVIEIVEMDVGYDVPEAARLHVEELVELGIVENCHADRVMEAIIGMIEDNYDY